MKPILNLFISVFIFALFVPSLSQAQPKCNGKQSARDLANRDTVGVISGSAGKTYARFAQDMADALDKDCELRIIPILGRGSVQNIADLLWLKGVDIAIVQSDVFEAFLRAKVAGVKDIKTQIKYIMKLYNEEIHILANKNIVNVKDLNGKTVSIGGKGSGTAATSRIIFDTLEIPIKPVNMPDSQAIDAVKTGKIAAAIFVTGKPADILLSIPKEPGLHFLRVEIDRNLEERGYISTTLTEEDYPTLFPSAKKSVETIAVGAVMAVYNWQKTSSKYYRTKKFAERLIKNLPNMKNSGAYHKKWKQVDPKLKVPGWYRFEPVSAIVGQ